MTPEEPLVRNVSDTARWVAVYRANENDRPDAVFRDPLARMLAGERGHEIAASIKGAKKLQWPFVARTLTVDDMVMANVQAGADMVINLAAGLDARPYRMTLPASLQWIEIDLPEILAYKEDLLKNETPRCKLERIRLDLADATARQAVFASLAGRASRVVIISEGLLIYLSAGQVSSLARDLAGQPAFQYWITDLASPGLLRIMSRELGKMVAAGGAPLGWKPVDVRSVMHVAARLKRLPFILSLFAKLPEPKGPPGKRRPWSGVCLLERS
jgi:methyltransferase (TIGR00027 family)